MSYRDRLRKEIKLPSGASIVIHKLNAYSESFLTPRKGDDDLQRGMVRSRYMLTNPLNGPLCFDGEALRIVDKDIAGPGEITITELEQADADKILEEIMEFSGLTKAGQDMADRKKHG